MRRAVETLQTLLHRTVGPGDKAAPTGFAGAADSPENFSVKGGRLFAHFRKSPTGSPNRAPRAASSPHPPANLTLAGRGVGGRPRPQTGAAFPAAHLLGPRLLCAESREHTPDCTPPEGIAHLLAANRLAAGPTSVLRQGVKVEEPEQPEPPPPPR